MPVKFAIMFPQYPRWLTQKIIKSKTGSLQISINAYVFTLHAVHERFKSPVCYCSLSSAVTGLLPDMVVITSSRRHLTANQVAESGRGSEM